MDCACIVRQETMKGWNVGHQLVSCPRLSHPLTPCSLNIDFAWLCNGWDHLEHCIGTSQGTCLATVCFCSISIYKLHLEKTRRVLCHYIILCLLLQLLCHSEEKKLCLQFLWLLTFSSSLLAHALPTMGSVNSVHSEIQWDNWHQEQDQQYIRFQIGKTTKNIPTYLERLIKYFSLFQFWKPRYSACTTIKQWIVEH